MYDALTMFRRSPDVLKIEEANVRPDMCEHISHFCMIGLLRVGFGRTLQVEIDDVKGGVKFTELKRPVIARLAAVAILAFMCYHLKWASLGFTAIGLLATKLSKSRAFMVEQYKETLPQQPKKGVTFDEAPRAREFNKDAEPAEVGLERSFRQSWNDKTKPLWEAIFGKK